MKRKVFALSLLFLLFTVSAHSALLSTIAAISVNADGSNFQYWNDNAPSLSALKAYIADITNPDSPNFIPVEDRICVSDMDGTFYGELAPTYGEWYLFFHRIFDDPTYHPTATETAYAKRCLAAAKSGKFTEDIDVGEDIAQSRAFEGMTLEEFEAYAENFAKTTPLDGLTNCTFAEAFYLPMVEVITYLQANGFKFYVVTGSDRQLARTLLKAIPSIQPYNVIGTDSMAIARREGFGDPSYFQFEKADVMVRGAYISTTNKMMKVSKICREIGKRPVVGLGNSGSDASMLNYAVFNDKYKGFAMGVCCDDDVRDWGSPDKAKGFKSTCVRFGWTPVSMRDDWKTIYGEEVKKTESQEFRK